MNIFNGVKVNRNFLCRLYKVNKIKKKNIGWKESNPNPQEAWDKQLMMMAATKLFTAMKNLDEIGFIDEV